MRDYWFLPKKTPEERSQQWVECGGQSDGWYSASLEGLDTQQIIAASRKKVAQIETCMLRKGYQYTGSCTKETEKNFPSCVGKIYKNNIN